MFQSIIALGHFVTIDLSGATKITSLMVLPFAHEDLAIILGGYIIVNDLMPATWVALSIYGGIVASDFALYGLGAAARTVPWLSRYAVDDRVRRVGEKLQRNVFGLVALCRVVPGVVFVAFVACGWARVSLWRFAIASFIISALYLPLMLYLVIVFGDALDDHIGFWAWPMLFVAIAATSYARKRIFAYRDGPDRETSDSGDTDTALPNNSFGMPPLSRADRKVAKAERIPPALFYLPLVINWLWLGLRHRCLTLPTAANPKIFAGGMWGETKSSYFSDVAPDQRKWIAGYIAFERPVGACEPVAETEQAMARLAEAGLDFPLIAKPDIGWHGHGVRRIDDRAQLEDYIAKFPDGNTMVLQHYVPYPAEAAVLYARLPGEAKGRVLSLTLRYFPHVIGNGKLTVRELIARDPRAHWKQSLHLGVDPTHRGVDMVDLDRVPERGEVVRIALIGNQRAGALYRDGHRYITPAMEARFDAIACSMTEFHYGRFDLRFETIEGLMRGEDFSIVEINGIGGEAIDCWDPHFGVRAVYRKLVAQQRLLFQIGEGNRARGFQPTKVGEFLSSLLKQGQLIRRYPASI
ncbi:MAG: ATP-grasp domain-containing protein [Rhodopseudomonas sp.]|nr:ATP-grasp domain-containing protein [Rhodopseudomonas sp.]